LVRWRNDEFKADAWNPDGRCRRIDRESEGEREGFEEPSIERVEAGQEPRMKGEYGESPESETKFRTVVMEPVGTWLYQPHANGCARVIDRDLRRV
jgi:hypothetical protein